VPIDLRAVPHGVKIKKQWKSQILEANLGDSKTF